MIRKGLNGLGWTEIDTVSDHVKGMKSVVHQEEVEGIGEYGFIKAHIDFVFVSTTELVIKEIKSAATIPTEPYTSHIYQTTLQMWLLKNKYPNLKVRASVVYHNWDTGESFDYPIDYNEAFLNVAIKQAEDLWNAIQTKTPPDPTIQPYCTKCSRKGTCPKLLFGAETELPDDFITMAERLFLNKEQEKSMKKLKDNLLAFMISAGLKKAVLGDVIIEVANGQYGPYLKIT